MRAVNKDTGREIVFVRLFVLDKPGPRYKDLAIEDYDATERLPSFLDSATGDEGNERKGHGRREKRPLVLDRWEVRRPRAVLKTSVD